MAAKRKPARVAIARLREIVEGRLADLQEELGREREGLSSIDKERDMKAAHMMARTLKEVLELERKERLARERRAKQRKAITDARRLELAKRIAALGRSVRGRGVSADRPAPDAETS
jgi:hypothetical protein